MTPKLNIIMSRYDSNKGRRKFDLRSFKENHKAWLLKGFTPDTITFTEKLGEQLVKDRMTTSQIRSIYGEVKRIQDSIGKGSPSNYYQSLLLLKPKIAYAAKRAGSRGVELFKEVFDPLLDTVVQREDSDRKDVFDSFVDFFEAVLAYHKAYGGRE